MPRGTRRFAQAGTLQTFMHQAQRQDYAFGQKFWADEYRLNALIDTYPKPYVAFMQGFVMGGGVGVSCHGSHRIVGKHPKSQCQRLGLVWCLMWVVPRCWRRPRTFR